MKTESSSLLIVDDDELSREGLARHLRRQGYTVALAKNGEKAIELLTDRHFDLVLLDVMMPRMNGLEVLKFLRRCDSLIDLPIIMVTAKREGEDVIEALELGANDYVTKPLDLPVVLARIRTQLALRRAVSQALELKQKLDVRNKELELTAAELATLKERGRRDQEAAARVQQAFLPALPEVPGTQLAWTFQPCHPFTGDFLTVFRPGDRHLGLCMLDINGHGSAAALLAVTISQLLIQLASPPPASGRCSPGSGFAPVPPTQVVGQMSKQLSGGAEAVQPFSLLYGILSLDTGDFRFVCAGHPGPIHLPLGSRPVLLEVTGAPVGIGTGGYREHAVKLQPGDRLVLYSDGATEARNADGEHFGNRRLLSVLEQTCRAPLAESLHAVWKDVEAWCGNVPRRDDLSLLAVERAGPGAPEGGAATGPA